MNAPGGSKILNNNELFLEWKIENHIQGKKVIDLGVIWKGSHYQLYCLMKFNWNSYILATFVYIFIHNFETIYARRETKLSPESAFYKLFNGIHYVGLTKSKSGVRPIKYSWGMVFLSFI